MTDSNNAREVVIPKWVLTSLVGLWTTFMLLFLSWGTWMTSNSYEQSALLREMTIELKYANEQITALQTAIREKP